MFYNRGERYFEFTNFAEYPILLDDEEWPTTEHYFQAQKFIGTPYFKYIRTLQTPRDAFSLSRQPQVSQWLRGDWEQVKQNIMYKALLAKFSQHSKLRAMLLGTGEKKIIEHTSNDSYWGDGGNGTGQNHLGRLLMKVRSELWKEPDENHLVHTSALHDADAPNGIHIMNQSCESSIIYTSNGTSHVNTSIGATNTSAQSPQTSILVQDRSPSMSTSNPLPGSNGLPNTNVSNESLNDVSSSDVCMSNESTVTNEQPHTNTSDGTLGMNVPVHTNALIDVHGSLHSSEGLPLDSTSTPGTDASNLSSENNLLPNTNVPKESCDLISSPDANESSNTKEQSCTSSNGFLGGDLSPSTNPSNDTPNTNMQSLHTILRVVKASYTRIGSQKSCQTSVV